MFTYAKSDTKSTSWQKWNILLIIGRSDYTNPKKTITKFSYYLEN